MDTFNNQFVNNWKDLAGANVGWEFEFYSNFPFIKTLELLNNFFDPIKIYAFNQYHSDFTPTENKFKIEPDLSGGSDMIELVTGPMDWMSARVILIKMLEFIRKYGYTDAFSSIHVNISFKDLDVKFMSDVKLILNIDEEFIYSLFESRRGNIYARSVKNIIPFEDFENSQTAYNSIVNSMELPDDTKYYGVNLEKKWKGWLEWRYLGGENYENMSDQILTLTDYFILQTKKAIEEPLNNEDEIKLMSYLDDNINLFKQYKTYDEFLSNIEGIKIEVDRIDEYDVVKNAWTKFNNKVFEIIKSCEKITGTSALINYNSQTNRVEIVDTTIDSIFYLKGVDFVDCILSNVTLYNCDIINTKVSIGHIFNCNVSGSDAEITNCKLTNCKANEGARLINSMFDGGLLDCYMERGVFRSGMTGEDAEVHNNVKVAKSDSFWSVERQDKLKKDLK